MKTVADQFAETLAVAGIKRIYGIVGDSLNGLTDALRRHEWIHVRHEEVAAFAAGAQAHLTGELIPPAITTEMAKGFTLYMTKAVFNDRADDLVDLARSNLRA